MAYPELRYKGQYTLQRVLTMPLVNGAALTIADIAKTVSLNATGEVIIGAAGANFWGVLRTVNANDDIATVDFSGVHEFAAAGTIAVGDRVVPDGAGSVRKYAVATDLECATAAVALTGAADTESVSIFFLN